LDASSKSNSDWQHVLNMINTVASSFNINSNCVRVAVIRYADRADASISLNRYSDINSLQQAVRSLTLIGGGSNLYTALQTLRNQVFASNMVRSGVTRAAGIVTDRLSCSSQITSEATQVKNTGVTIFGVAVTSTSQVDINCLRGVVTNNQVFEVPTYSQLNTYASRAVQYVCALISTPGPGPAPSKYFAVSHVG